MKILFIHGFDGKTNGESYNILTKTFPNAEIVALDIDFNDVDDLMQKYWDAGSFDYIIANSYGAFFAMQIQGNGKKILINPALPEDVARITNGNYDITKSNKLKDVFFNEMLDGEFVEETTFIFGINDELVNNKEFFKNTIYCNSKYYDFDMGHKLTEDCATHILNGIINEN